MKDVRLKFVLLLSFIIFAISTSIYAQGDYVTGNEQSDAFLDIADSIVTNPDSTNSDVTDPIKFKKAFTVSPNPTANEFVLQFGESDMGQGTAEVQIFDNRGIVVFEQNVANANGAKINIEELSKGIYIIVVQTSTKVYNQRLIKVQ